MRFEVHGTGPWLFLGPPLRATTDAPSAEQRNALLDAYIESLGDSYRLVVLDYPPTGQDADRVADVFTPERVCADILDVADRVGADRFAWYGYSWGGVVGLQLAGASSRVSALVCGGWPPLDAPYGDLLGWGELQYAKTKLPDWKLTRAFYGPLLTASERDTVSRIMCPRMAFAGAGDIIVSDGYTFPVGPLLAKHRAELEAMGWTVRSINGHKHDLYMHPDIVVPLVREFLDTVMLQDQGDTDIPRACMSIYSLRRPDGESEWRAYHGIRRRVLFENRGIHDYDEHHPDEYRSGNYPLLLLCDDEPLGTIRIDIDGQVAIFRRVAIIEAWQRKGHGTAMMKLAEDFARSHGCTVVRSFVNPGAVGFYERCGFQRDASAMPDSTHTPMTKTLLIEPTATS